MRKKLFLFFVFIFCFAAIFVSAEKEKIVVFEQIGCPHCVNVENFIEENNLEDFFEIEQKEIRFNQENAKEFMEACDKCNIPLEKRVVPMALLNDKCVLGDQQIIGILKEKLQNIDTNNPPQKPTTPLSHRRITIPLIIGASLVDAINPCAFAVLIILITTVLAAGKRKRALLAGLAFSLAIFVSYFLMGLGLYSAIAAAKFSSIFMKLIGGLAIIVGLLNIKDYFWYGGGGFVMEVPRKWRPMMKALIRSVTSIYGAFIIGMLVSLFLLPCTSGPYIVILGMLAQKETFWPALWYLVFYNLIFILPMVLITLGVYFGFRPEKAEEVRQKRIKLLHLIAGLIMLGMGIVILSGLV
jgi:cytochrome c biogenesis protein CcdA